MKIDFGKLFRRFLNFLRKKSGFSLEIEKKTTSIKIKLRKD
jgi:hypothetical protein